MTLVTDGPPLRFDPPLGSCPLCGGARIGRFDRDFKGITIDRCQACGLRFMNPQYTDDALDEYYSRYTDPQAAFDPAQVRRNRKNRDFDLLCRFVRGGRFLGVGCGDGLELLIAREHGFTVEGFDVDADAAARVEQNTGIKVHHGQLGSLSLPEESYDCIYMDQVLEHPKSPSDYLRFVHRHLKPGGVFYAGVPNIGSLSNRWKTLGGRAGLRRGNKRGSHYDTWHHLHYYTPGVLKLALSRYFQFEVLAVVGDPDADDDGVMMSLRRRFPALESSLIVIARKKR